MRDIPSLPHNNEMRGQMLNHMLNDPDFADASHEELNSLLNDLEMPEMADYLSIH